MKFTELNLSPQLLEALDYMGFKDTTPIQEQVMPAFLDGKDLIACAQTGTGKTAAFVLPVLQKITEEPGDVTSCLIVCPTRELAQQIDQQVQAFAYFLGIESLAVYGGGDGMQWEEQKRALTKGCNIIIATPGKLISHLLNGYVKFDQVKYFILDEADRMLDMNFHDDILKILSYLKADKLQTCLFSATMNPKIKKLAKTLLTDPVEVMLELSKPAEGVIQGAYECGDGEKMDILVKLIKGKEKLKSILIFSSTKKNVGNIVNGLKKAGFQAAGISSNLKQEEREDVLQRFSAKRIQILVATDVLSRGIDIKDINLVVNYDVPGDAEDYVHRIGRTARANTTGVAITLINNKDRHRFKRIEELIGMKVGRV